jgi:hypothetical protein
MIAVLLCNMTVDDESIKSRVDRYIVAFLWRTYTVKCRNFVAGNLRVIPSILRSLETFLQSPHALSGLRVVRSNTCRNVGKPGRLLSKDEANGPHESYHWRPFLQVNISVITIIKVCMIEVLYFVVRVPVYRRIESRIKRKYVFDTCLLLFIYLAYIKKYLLLAVRLNRNKIKRQK